MVKRILIIQGHPDASTPHCGHALAASYASGARDVELSRMGRAGQ
jgi:hypothetical protein